MTPKTQMTVILRGQEGLFKQASLFSKLAFISVCYLNGHSDVEAGPASLFMMR